MMNNEEFCALVHEKAQEKKRTRRKYAAITASFCLVILVAGLWPHNRMMENAPQQPGHEIESEKTYEKTGEGSDGDLTYGESDGAKEGTTGDPGASEGGMSYSSADDAAMIITSSLLDGRIEEPMVIENSTELADYLNEFSELLLGGIFKGDGTPARTYLLTEIATRFDDAFFRDHVLISCGFQEGSGSISYTVSGVELKDGTYSVSFVKHGLYDETTGEPLAGTCDVKTTVLLIPAPKGGTGIMTSILTAGLDLNQKHG